MLHDKIMVVLIFMVLMCTSAFAADDIVDQFNQISPLSQVTRVQESDQDIIATLSPYAQVLHSLLSADGILETLYNTSFSPCEAKVAFQYGAFIYSQHYGVANPMELHILVGDQAEMTFSGSIFPLNYFRAFSRTIETFLQKFFSPATYSDIAHKHHGFLKGMLSDYGPGCDAITALHLVVSSNMKIFESLGQHTRGDVLRVLLRAHREMYGLRKRVEHIIRAVELL